MAFWILLTLAGLFLLTSLLPLVRQPHGIFRVFDFPRMQIFVVCLITGGFGLALVPFGSDLLLILGLLICALTIQLIHILRFSPIWPRSVRKFTGASGTAPKLRMLVANVKQSNTDYQRLIDVVKRTQPDIALFMETDAKWAKALGPVAEDLETCIAHPLDNSYGMVLYSRLKLRKQQIRFLTNEEVPSFDCVVELDDGTVFRLLTVHPEPPVVHGDTIGRDAEIAKVAKLVREVDGPVIVTGDLNDVAWSPGTPRFVRISRLLDPREGRGPYNSFDARYFFLRWPLDHIFLSSHFQVIAMKRMPFVGSDHFPMLYELALLPDGQPYREPEPTSSSDIEQADDLVETEEARDRRPVGHDWEKDED
ncbi:MAG: endonuclease/exonuclease/phosphatase family protein [Hyphomicrobiales bacterium]